MSRIFVAADYSQLESWLTAFFAGDQVMYDELLASLEPGGLKGHAINAGLLYEIDPRDAKTHMVVLGGLTVPAYFAGKRISHLINYGGQASKIASTLWLPIKFAEEAYEKIASKYHATTHYRSECVDEIFGVGEYQCDCGFRVSGMAMLCPTCKAAGQHKLTRWVGWSRHPAGELWTPFGRRRIYCGRRGECANAAASQKPQSGGASVAYKTLQRLNGFETVNGVRKPWPRIDGTRVATFTYDEFVLECEEEDKERVISWLAWTMEQAWPELNGLRFPVEVSAGRNWGDYHEKNNPGGLRDVGYKAFNAEEK